MTSGRFDMGISTMVYKLLFFLHASMLLNVELKKLRAHFKTLTNPRVALIMSTGLFWHEHIYVGVKLINAVKKTIKGTLYNFDPSYLESCIHNKLRTVCTWANSQNVNNTGVGPTSYFNVAIRCKRQQRSLTFDLWNMHHVPSFILPSKLLLCSKLEHRSPKRKSDISMLRSVVCKIIVPSLFVQIWGAI